MEGSSLRRLLDEWFDVQSIRPIIKCEVSDRDLFEVLGHAGQGVFPIPTVLEHRIRKLFAVRVVGRVDAIREKYFAITTERKLKHPAVVAIFESARAQFAR
jgi:LysR family transcriptional activator of nhaA